jgi:hypothetical protein
MLELLVAWGAIGVALMLLGLPGGRKSAGVPLAYFWGLSLIHTPGAAVYMNSGSQGGLAGLTYIGFTQTVIGMAAFLGGVMLGRHFAPRTLDKNLIESAASLKLTERLGIYYLIGGVAYFVVGSLAAIPSFQSLIATLSSLLVIGASLQIWTALQEERQAKFIFIMALLPLLPVITTIRGGFINFGIYWLLSIACFAFAQTKRRSVLFALSPLVIFVGISIFVNYMASREAYRNMTWWHDTSLMERIDGFTNMFRDFKWFDGDDEKQLELINERLNQNLLVGEAVERLNSGAVDYANGSTLVDLVLGLIPRAVWPDKPAVGGGGSLVQTYTGEKVAGGTSVGAGQVLEFYINFGWIGVVGGFIIYGLLIGWMDVRIIEGLYLGDHKRTLIYFMVCQAMLQPGGNLLEIVVSAAASAVVAKLIGNLLIQQPAQTPAGAAATWRQRSS